MSRDPLTRRRFVRHASLALGAAAVAPVLGRARLARAETTVRSIERQKSGTLIELGLDNGPFPSKGESYEDDTTWVYIPHHYRTPSSQKVDAVVHFHGHRTTAIVAMKRDHLREQLLESKQNAILIVPQGPVNASDSSGGKLARPRGFVKFMGEVRRAIQLPQVRAKLGDAAIPDAARIGKVVVSAHSGGFYVAAQCLKHGSFNINEVYLFDALYGERHVYRDWVLERRDQSGSERHKLVCYYTGEKPTAQSEELMAEFDAEGLTYHHEKKEGQLTRAQFTRGRVVFVRTGTEHGGVTYRNNTLRDCLFASCLERRLSSSWFDDKNKKRKIEKR